MADIIGTENAIKFIELNEATCFALYKDYKQNATPIFKHEGKQNAKCIQVFKDIANSISSNEYEVIIWKDNEVDTDKIRFTFINSNNINTNESLLSQSKNTDLEFIECKIENKFLKEKISSLEKEIDELESIIDEYEKEVAILKETIKDPKNEMYSKLNNLLEKNFFKTEPALADNVHNKDENKVTTEKKEALKKLIETINKNFTSKEIYALNNFVVNNISLIKNQING